jgi:hypothetical protein
MDNTPKNFEIVLRLELPFLVLENSSSFTTLGSLGGHSM